MEEDVYPTKGGLGGQVKVFVRRDTIHRGELFFLFGGGEGGLWGKPNCRTIGALRLWWTTTRTFAFCVDRLVHYAVECPRSS